MTALTSGRPWVLFGVPRGIAARLLVACGRWITASKAIGRASTACRSGGRVFVGLDDNGWMLVSKQPSEGDRRLFELQMTLRRKPDEGERHFLAQHRNSFNFLT